MAHETWLVVVQSNSCLLCFFMDDSHAVPFGASHDVAPSSDSHVMKGEVMEFLTVVECLVLVCWITWSLYLLAGKCRAYSRIDHGQNKQGLPMHCLKLRE